MVLLPKKDRIVSVSEVNKNLWAPEDQHLEKVEGVANMQSAFKGPLDSTPSLPDSRYKSAPRHGFGLRNCAKGVLSAACKASVHNQSGGKQTSTSL